MNDKIEHLKMIEDIISRMANNSIKAKEFTIAIVSLFGVLLSINSEKQWLFVLIIPIIALWFMDSKYLQQERTFRKLYDFIRNKEDKIDFNMNPKQVKLESTDHSLCFCNCLFSWSEVFFYIFIIAGIVGVYFILR
ncbi:MAG: hypothetical protein MJ228_03320 [Bacilli bacterium]|nr:hypothetical protein [Bacilli bacterium]